MPAYVIAESTILDDKTFEIYRQHAAASVVKYGGRYLARGGNVEALEGECAPRVVLLEFPSMDMARVWYGSPEYAKALEIRNQALTRNLFLVDGVAHMLEPINETELSVLRTLDKTLHLPSVLSHIAPIVDRVERNLESQMHSIEAWEPIPLEIFGTNLPNDIKSSWVFILRANTVSGAERHPNSRQRMVSYRGRGDFQVYEEKWKSHHLVSDFSAPLFERWISIPINTWHQAVVPNNNWVVVSFHTVVAEELIEERPDSSDPNLSRQRRYLDVGNTS